MVDSCKSDCVDSYVVRKMRHRIIELMIVVFVIGLIVFYRQSRQISHHPIAAEAMARAPIQHESLVPPVNTGDSFCQSPSLPRGALHVVIGGYKYDQHLNKHYLLDFGFSNAKFIFYRRIDPLVPLRSFDGPCGKIFFIFILFFFPIIPHCFRLNLHMTVNNLGATIVERCRDCFGYVLERAAFESDLI